MMTPFALNVLITLALLLPLALYLLSVRGKSAATWWLALALSGLALANVAVFFRLWVYWPAVPAGLGDWSGILFRLNSFLVPLVMWAYVQFAYTLLGNPFPRESRLVRLITGGLGLGLAGLVVYSYFAPAWLLLSGRLLTLFAAGLFVWAVVVFLRKWRWARREEGREASRAARAFRTYVLLTGLMVVGIVFNVAPETFAFPLPDVLLALGRVSFLAFYFGLVVAHVNYSSEPTTFQVKLVGLTLAAVLAAFAAVTVVLFPYEEVLGGTPVEAGRALRFEPGAEGGYRLSRRNLPYETELGEDLKLGDDTDANLALPFGFPFGGEVWDSTYVSANGAVVFGESITRGDSLLYNHSFFYDARPKVAPLYADLDASSGGGVYARLDTGRAVISWHDVPRFGAAGTRNRVQLVLHRSGAIDLVYDRVEIPNVQFYYGLRGIVAGGTAPERSVMPWEDQLPLTLAAGADLVEDFDLAQRLRFHEATRDLAWLIIGATVFILLVFPFFFRSSLARPLERLLVGVQRVNEGDLDAEVPVGVRDEVGHLTHHFNRMTQSLRRYSREMEHLVEERTAALKQSQQQLVHAEKMASLGALTAGIAHEIKNPLNFVNNFAQLSRELVEELDSETDPEEVQAILADLKLNAAKIEEHGQRADSIVRSMMQHARGGGGEREAVDLNALVEEHVDLAYHGKRAQTPGFAVTIERDYDASVGSVEVVPQDLGRVVLNLVSNAFDAVTEHAASRNGQYAPKVTVSTRRVGEGVEVRVADNGPGMAAEVKARVFEPFFTTKPSGSGTGLGLSMSHDVVVQGHGGTLAVESEPGQGAAFVVRLPSTST